MRTQFDYLVLKSRFRLMCLLIDAPQLHTYILNTIVAREVNSRFETESILIVIALDINARAVLGLLGHGQMVALVSIMHSCSPQTSRCLSRADERGIV